MKTAEFLTQISDEQGPLQEQASDVMERMSAGDFEELMDDMKRKHIVYDTLLTEISRDRHPVTMDALDEE